jgi:5-methylthioadenosine/S-adenosylhomocysteine deaminase
MTVLFTNARILTMDGDLTEHARGWLLVEGDTIAALGPGEPPAGTAGEISDCGGRLIMPGLVNTHCHLAMTLFRGLGEDVDDRLYRYILPLERRFVGPEMVRTGTALAALESILGGTTTVADMYYFEAEVGRVLDGAGLRGIVGQTLADFSPPDHADFDEGFALVEALVDEFAGHPRITPSIAPHAPYSTGREVMARIAEWSYAHPDVPVQMHLAESSLEVDWARNTHGASTVAVTREAGLLKQGLIAAHCLQLDAADIAMMAEAGVHVATNPRSNGKAGRGIAPVEALRQAGMPVGMGSDGAMSGNTLDLFTQFAPVSMFAKLKAGSRRPLPAVEVVRMATIEGARVLGMADRIGSLEAGKRADLIMLDLSAPRLHPIYDIHAMLVFAALPTDVVASMVDGRWLMRNRSVETLEPARILADAGQLAGAFRAEMTRIDAGSAR